LRIGDAEFPLGSKGHPTQRPKRHDSQRNFDQNRARTEDILAITVRQEFLFRHKVGRNSTENKAILEQTLSVSTLRPDQNRAFSGIAPTLTSPILLNFAQFKEPSHNEMCDATINIRSDVPQLIHPK
jgi:hypothetical protein